VTATRHCLRRDNGIECFVGDNRARGLHANERVAPLNTSNAYILAYLGLSGAQIAYPEHERILGPIDMRSMYERCSSRPSQPFDDFILFRALDFYFAA